jgi:hypothetical protein
MAMTIMTSKAGEPDIDLLQEWADDFNHTMPVLWDDDGAFMWTFVEGTSVTWPYEVLLDRGAVIDTKGEHSAWIDDAVDLAQN